jgi:hypothetical protein
MHNVILDEITVPAMQGMMPGHYVVMAMRDTGGGMTREVAACLRPVLHHKGNR